MSKGSVPRPVDKNKFDTNYARIFKKDSPPPDPEPVKAKDRGPTCCEIMEARIDLLTEELDMRDETRKCRECEVWLDGGEPHMATCKYYRLDAKIVRESLRD